MCNDVTSLIYNISKLYLLFFYPINLARGLLLLLIVTINQHLLSLISTFFFVCLFVIHFIDFCSDIYYFLLLPLGLICSFLF